MWLDTIFSLAKLTNQHSYLRSLKHSALVQLTFAPADRDEDFIHALGTQRGLDEITDGDGADEAGESGDLRLLLLGSASQHVHRVQGRLKREQMVTKRDIMYSCYFTVNFLHFTKNCIF